MSDKKIAPVRCIRGQVHLPGDKSISHRALILAAIAEGDSEITGISTAQDVRNTMQCLRDLGIDIEEKGDKIIVHGKGKYGLSQPKGVLDAGNSGTTIRLLSGILAAQNFVTTIDGDESLRNRPMRRIIEPLQSMGAHIESNGYKAPLTIRGHQLKAIDYASTIASAQVKSCILLAGLYASGMTRVTEPAQSRDHTERMLVEFGALARCTQSGAGVRGPADLHPCNIDVPGDISAAAFFLVAACILPDSAIKLFNVGINPTRTGILDALAAMGAQVSKTDATTVNNEPRATLEARSSRLRATNLGGSMIPRIIDEIPILAVAATQADGITVIRDAQELRVKETDRIEATVVNLKRMGANVRDTKDGMVITGPSKLKGAEIDSYNDHRIAMSFTIAGLIAQGETIIDKADCVDISFPGFFEILDSVNCD